MICIIGILLQSRCKSTYNARSSKYDNRYDWYNSRCSGCAGGYNSICNSRYRVRIIHIVVGMIVIVYIILGITVMSITSILWPCSSKGPG